MQAPSSRPRRKAVVFALTALTVLGAAAAASGAGGNLIYRNCVTGENDSGPPGSGACAAIPASQATTNSGLDAPRALAVSPDGASVYVASSGDDAIARFKRNTTNGALTYKDCLSGETQSGSGGTGACTAIAGAASNGANSGLDDPVSIGVSADGKSLYAASVLDDSIARFKRNTTSGALAYQGCISGESTNACAVKIPTATANGSESGLDGLNGLTVSADGTGLYAIADGDSSVARFSRNATSGALTYRSCVTGDTRAVPACGAIPAASADGSNSGLDFPDSLALSADGKSLYVASGNDDSVARVRPKPSGGRLIYMGCLSGQTESGPDGSGACDPIPSASNGGGDSGMDSPRSVTVTADGDSVYVVAGNDDAVARFDRDPAGGALAYVGCDSAQTESGPTGSAACAQLPTATSFGVASGMNEPNSVVASADGASVYTASANDEVARFTRAGGGALSFDDCIAGAQESGPLGSGACAASPSAAPLGDLGADSGLDLLIASALSPDDRSLYVAAFGDDSIATFKRIP